MAVVTVNYRSEDVLPTLLGSVPRATSRAVRTVVADNLPTPASNDVATAFGASLVPLPANPGYGAAINAAVGTLPAPVRWILIVNPDVELGDGAIDRLIETAEQSPTIGAVGPAVRDDAGRIYPSARRIPSLRLGIGHAVFGNLWPGNPWTRAYREETSPYRRDAGWLSGSCLLMRRDVFDELGGFDETYFMYFEDVDLGYRLTRSGYRSVYEPGASVTHVGGTSTRHATVAMLRAHHDSARRFLARKYSGPWLAPLRGALSLGLSVRYQVLRRTAGSPEPDQPRASSDDR